MKPEASAITDVEYVTMRQRSPTPPAPTIRCGREEPRARPPMTVPRATPRPYLNHVEISCAAPARARRSYAGRQNANGKGERVRALIFGPPTPEI